MRLKVPRYDLVGKTRAEEKTRNLNEARRRHRPARWVVTTNPVGSVQPARTSKILQHNQRQEHFSNMELRHHLRQASLQLTSLGSRTSPITSSVNVRQASWDHVRRKQLVRPSRPWRLSSVLTITPPLTDRRTKPLHSSLYIFTRTTRLFVDMGETWYNTPSLIIMASNQRTHDWNETTKCL